MDTRTASELRTVLVGAPLPAEKARLLEYAVHQHAEPQFLHALRSLPDREYESLDEVAEELLSVQAGPGDG
jgi:hypothetical protein